VSKKSSLFPEVKYQEEWCIGDKVQTYQQIKPSGFNIDLHRIDFLIVSISEIHQLN